MWKRDYRLLAALVLFVVLTPSLRAASLIEVRVQHRGSPSPEGDLLEFAVLFRPGEDSVAVEVRAYESVERSPEGPDNPQIRPIGGRGEAFRDANGAFLIRKRLLANKERLISNESIVVPYDALELAVGVHRTGYEVVLVGEESEQASATPLSTIEVLAEPREISHVSFKKISRVRAKTRPVFVVSNGQIESMEETLNEEVVTIVSEPARLTTRYVTAESPADMTPGRNTMVTMVTADGAQISGWLSTAAVKDGFAIHNNGKLTEVKHADVETVALHHNAPQYVVALDVEMKGELRHRPWVPQSRVPIYFATNRNVAEPASSESDRFGNTISDLSFGMCSVSIPLTVHRRGRLERPAWWERRDPDKHILVERVTPLPSETFYDRMKIALINQEDDDVLVYVHGYANTFEDCVLASARLKHDTEFTGPVIAFAWPSEGRQWGVFPPTGPYRRDEKKAADSAGALEAVFTELLAQRGDSRLGKIHVLAHSMGSRIVLDAMQTISAALPQDEVPFGHVVFAAPDAAVRTFAEAFETIRHRADDFTLYFCEDDFALSTSQRINNDSRVGQYHLLLDRLDNVDCTNANTSWIGHAYYVSRDILLIDLQMLWMLDRRPDDRRPPLQDREFRMRKYWRFP